MKLLQVCDSYFPIGAFTLSNGLETYVQKEIVHDIDTLREYIKHFLYLFRYNDLGFLRFAWEYTESGSIDGIEKLDNLLSASKSPQEVRNGSEKLCVRFIKAVEVMDKSEGLMKYKALIRDKKCCGHHCIAMGIYTGDQGIDEKLAMSIYAYNAVSGIVNNAAKMIPLSQLQGQKLLREYLPMVLDTVEETMKVDYEELGISLPAFDIRAMEHERLYSRLYMS